MERLEVLPLAWASNIEVARAAEYLTVKGSVAIADEQVQVERDLYHGYREAPRDWGKGKRCGAPHIEFANAKTDQQLLAFVKKFGPVAASVVQEVTTEDEWTLTATQPLEALRRERQTYESALTLLAELDQKPTANLRTIQICIAQLVEGCWPWTSEWQNEAQYRRSKGLQPPRWHFGNEVRDHLVYLKVSAERHPNPTTLSELLNSSGAFDCGHQVICNLINAFAVEVQYFGNTRLEGPPWDSLRFGIRPVLYYILRLEYLRRGRVRLCQNLQCNRLFRVERAGQQFCDEDCSRRHRQRDYWSRHGSKLRRKRQHRRKEGTNKPDKNRLDGQLKN